MVEKAKRRVIPVDKTDGSAGLRIVQRKLADLLPYAKNYRKHTDEQVSAIAASIEAIGFRFPVAIDERGEIIAGHGRVLAAKKLRMVEVPCILHEDLTEEQKRALRIADNRLAELAGNDKSTLAQELSELAEAGFDLSATGYSDKDLEDLLSVDEVEAKEVDVSQVYDEFWMSIRGPLPKQPDALEKLREALESIDGVDVQIGTTQVGGL